MSRRVVVTGLGLVTPLGLGPRHVWQRLINGETAISTTGELGEAYKQLPSRVGEMACTCNARTNILKQLWNAGIAYKLPL
jgi:3-oxoacyl-(acyl-carrier-protein) synthase